MALNPDYVVSQGLQQLFADKDTGNFLRDGYVLFFRDTARTVGKPVYTLSGSPPNYTYVTYGFLDTNGAWRVDLNDQGAFDDVVYYYPLDADGNVDLYFIQVYSADDVFQFSVEGWPNFTEQATGTPVDVNYVPNGQFLLHTDLPATDDYDAGEVRAAVTDIAWGGWTFNRPNASSAKDIVAFQRIGSYVTNPAASPRYQLRVKTEVPNPGDSYKDIRLKYNDVNKFASTTQEYTFAFTAQTNSGSDLSIQLILIKNYGTGGSTQTETSIKTFIITNSETIYNATFTFGDNTGKTIGASNDDYLQLVIRLPVDSVQDVSFTDVILAQGSFNQPEFPQTPDRQFISESLGGGFPVPAADGSDLYLTARLTKEGWVYDDSEIGDWVPESQQSTYVDSLSPTTNRMLGDGNQYETAGYSPLGIPFRRLQQKYWVSSLNIPKYGTGRQFVTAYISDSTSSNIRLTTNIGGSVTTPSDGSAPTGFTFTNIHTGDVTYAMRGIYVKDNELLVWNDEVGATGGAAAGDSGFTVTVIRNSSAVKQLTSILTTSPAALAGKYFEIDSTAASFFVWFKVDGSGTQPAHAGTGIEIDLLSTQTSAEVAKIISEALCGYQNTTISVLAASAIPASSFFIFDTTTAEYYVWYKKDGVGTDPAPSGRIGIEVDILTADTAAQVATKTQIAINQKYFAVPDARGMFLRGWDNGANIDTDAAFRWSNNSLFTGDNIGTFEFDEIIQHRHVLSQFGEGVFNAGTDTDMWVRSVETQVTNYEGGSESRGINMSVNYVIKY